MVELLCKVTRQFETQKFAIYLYMHSSFLINGYKLAPFTDSPMI